MLRQRALWSLVGIGISLGLAHSFGGMTVAGSDEIRQGETGPTELLVKFSRKTSLSDIREINEKMGVEVASQASDGWLVLVRLPEGTSLAEIKSAYEALPSVEYVEPNYRVHIPN